MNSQSSLRGICLIVISAVLLPLVLNAGELTTWTSTAGKSVEAEFVALEYGIVRLKKADGKPIKIPLAQLIQEDQDRVNELAGESTSAAPQLSGLKKAGDGRLTDEELAQMITDVTEEKSGEKWHMSASFTQPRLDPEKNRSEIRKYSKTGRIPYRITADLMKIQENRGIRQKVRVDVYVVNNDDDEVVYKKRMDILKLCPS